MIQKFNNNDNNDSFSSCFFFAFSFFSFFFCFSYSNLLCSNLHYFSYSFRHFVIFISLILHFLSVPLILGLSIFFNLNFYFLINSELITNLITPLSNNASTIIPFCILILSNLIFTITFLSMSLLFRLQQDILFTILLSIVNLL